VQAEVALRHNTKGASPQTDKHVDSRQLSAVPPGRARPRKRKGLRCGPKPGTVKTSRLILPHSGERRGRPTVLNGAGHEHDTECSCDSQAARHAGSRRH
jgi:hypothetical protein